jgi:hypothetical protein
MLARAGSILGYNSNSEILKSGLIGGRGDKVFKCLRERLLTPTVMTVKPTQ